MNDYGNAIKILRRKNQMTQTALAEELNVTGQAVSKWEKNMAQPDFDTILKITKIFNITLDEFTRLSAFGEVEATPTEAEVAATASVQEAPAPAPVPMLIGVCSRCGTSIYKEEELGARSPKLLCKRCKQAIVKEIEERAKREEQKRKEEEKQRLLAEAYRREEQMHSLRKSLIIPGIIIGILMIIAIISAPKQALTSILGYLLLYAVVVQIIWDNNWIAGIFHGTFGWTFAKPGLIIPLSLEGFLWAFCVKIAMAIIWFLISCAVTVAGLLLCVAITPFVLPFAILTTVRQIKAGNFKQ